MAARAPSAKELRFAAAALRGAIGYGDAGLIARERAAAEALLGSAEVALCRLSARAADADLTGAGPKSAQMADAYEAAVREMRAALGMPA